MSVHSLVIREVEVETIAVLTSQQNRRWDKRTLLVKGELPVG